MLYVESPEAMKIWRVAGAEETRKAAGVAARGNISLMAVLKQHYWWWMVLAGIVMLMLEMALAERKRTAGLT